jgi:Fungal N-terminal domain of STAND proteins
MLCCTRLSLPVATVYFVPERCIVSSVLFVPFEFLKHWGAFTMDPLSISASIAGLLSLAITTVAKLDALFNDFRSRPSVLLSISQEMSALCLVLGQLEGQLRGTGTSFSGTKANEKTLLSVLDVCMQTFRQIGSQISELQSGFRKGSLGKAYTFMLYSSKIKEISALRDDLEKCKATLLIALQIHKP